MADIYVNASIAGDSGTGTTGDPYGDLQYALDQTTQGASGDTFWLYGTETLAGSLSLSTYGTPGYNKPCCIRGWNGVDAATDGGGLAAGTFDGVINGNDGDFSIDDGSRLILFYNLKLYNTGAADILNPDGYHTGAILCELSDCETIAVDASNVAAVCAFNYIHDISGVGVTGGRIIGNYFKDGATKTFSAAIDLDMNYSLVERNIISLSAAGANGIDGGPWCQIIGNSILHTAGNGTGSGIVSTGNGSLVWDNVIEGFAGAGGDAIAASGIPSAFGNNSYYNCINGIAFDSKSPINLGGDEGPLASSPFAKSGADTYANRMTYFAPNDVGSVRGGAYGQ